MGLLWDYSYLTEIVKALIVTPQGHPSERSFYERVGHRKILNILDNFH